MHDYDIGWDYEIDENVKKEHQALIDIIVGQYKKEILPNINAFKDFKVTAIILEKEGIAVYCVGSCEEPIIGVDIQKTLKAAEEFDTSFETAIRTSILHELAHAIQEYKDKEFDEDEAEDFAFDYDFFGTINKI